MLTLLQIIYSIIIGVVQGISEWLPISSKTQVLITSIYLLHITYQQAYTFGLFMEIGTIIAAVIYFRKELYALIQALMGSRDHMKRKLLIYVVVATVITGIIAVPLYLIADSITGLALGIPMVVLGAILISDAILIRYSKKANKAGIKLRKLEDLSLKNYIIIGIAQGIAALPGVSRSGITTSTMLLMNVEPKEAFRLSFIIGIFAALAAFALTILVSKANVMAALSAISLTGLVIAIIISTLISLFLIDFLIKIAGKQKIIYVTAGLGVIAITVGILYLAFGI
jgi:undecaprenyl-diphosphatase